LHAEQETEFVALVIRLLGQAWHARLLADVQVPDW
jgi:hypothetical protein